LAFKVLADINQNNLRNNIQMKSRIENWCGIINHLTT